MTAPANIMPWTIERYAPTLDAFRPGCGEEERRRRCGILYLRDRATAGLQVAGWEAAAILRHIEALASVHGLATMPPAQLEELHHSMTRLMSVAVALDMRGPRGEF